MRRFAALALAVLLGWSAAAQRIRDIDIRVELEKDGSAWITQHWDVQVTSGTEWYIPIGNLGPMTVSSLSVSENGEAFQSLGDNWDVDRSREWKTGKCGIVRKHNGVELCWGQGEYGDHRWTARFRVTGLVQSLDDADAFNFMFVNPGLVAPPEHAKVVIVPAFDGPAWTYDNTRVWGFGFYGDINVRDGQVVAESSEQFSYSSKLIALVKWEKGVFEPAVVRGGAFEDFLNTALEGSSYGEDDDSGWFLVLFGILFIAGFGLVLFALVASALGYKWKKSIFGKTKITGWWRDVPLEGNLLAAEYLLDKGKRFSVGGQPQGLIGAYFLRWILNGALSVQPDPKSSKRVNLLFKADHVSSDDVEEDLFQMARSAAGSNQILEKGEFEKWSTANYKKMTAWPERASARGRSWFRDKGYFVKDDVCTPAGATEACHLVEFHNFLKDFTLSGERGSAEVGLWKDYLVFAQLFGLADKVAKQFQKLYPAAFDELARSTGMDTTTLIYTMNWTNSISTRAFTNAMTKAGNINGTGGHTSFGGGGGFSGGGFGGGSR